MQFHGHFGDIQRGGDLLVSQSLGNHPQDFHLAGTQGAMGAALGQVRSHDGIHILSSLVNLTHGAEEFLPDDALDDVSPGAGLHGAINLLFSGVRRKHEDGRIREFAKDGSGALSTAHSR
jgi:hypothetical protein